jgi:hypothetical protein
MAYDRSIGWRWNLLYAAFVALGCGRTIEFASAAGGADSGPDGYDAGGSAETGAADGGGAPEGGDPSCLSPRVPFAPLRRLTTFAYANTLRDLLGATASPTTRVPGDADEDASNVSAPLVEGYHLKAHELALAVTKDAAAVHDFIGCDVATAGDDACKRQFLRNFVTRAFRRPAMADDMADLDLTFENGRRLGGGFAGGVRAVVEVVLQAPEFLYQVEFGEQADEATPDLTRPSPHETAARLSYLLWGSTPDDVLLDAANRDALRSPSQIDEQAERLLADPRAHDVVRHFYEQLYGLTDLDVASLQNHPSFTPELPDLFRQETERFIDDVVWQGPGTFEALLTSPFTWMNGPLAKFYGVGGVTGDAFEKVDVDPKRRGGLLTQGRFLAARSFAGWTHPTMRGRIIVESFLCMAIPSAPDGAIAPPPDPDPNATTRERLERATTGVSCAACHRILDPPGFAFEHYDALGLWRDTENGRPIDATGRLHDNDARFDGAVELVQHWVHDRDVEKCHVGEWLAFAFGRTETEDDRCSRRTLERAFDRTNGNVRELLRTLTQTDGFLYRRTRE